MQQSPSSEQYTPPLSVWDQLWRYLAAAAISAALWGTLVQAQWEHHRGQFWVDLAGGLVAFALVPLRRRWPFPVAAVTNALTLVSGLAAGPATLAMVSLATRRVPWQMVAVGVIGIVGAQGYTDTQNAVFSSSKGVSILVTVTVNVALVMWGMYIGSRRELLWSLRERARQAEEGQELRIRAARSGERERIAREMHDVLAHRITLVAMQSGALAFRSDLPVETVRETAGLIQASANAALTDLRAVLGTLRDDSGASGALDRPQPTLHDVAPMVQEARRAGMSIDLHTSEEVAAQVDGGTSPWTAQVGRTAYRIVQEGLTNAHKHSLGARVTVSLAGAPGEGLDITVYNPRRPGGASGAPGAGLGLVGLRERTVLTGGHLEVSEKDGFRLHAWLPWPA